MLMLLLCVALTGPAGAAVQFGQQSGLGQSKGVYCDGSGGCGIDVVVASASTPASLAPGVDYSGGTSIFGFESQYTADSVTLTLSQDFPPSSSTTTYFDSTSSWSVYFDLDEMTSIDVAASHVTGYLDAATATIWENCSLSDCSSVTYHGFDFTGGDMIASYILNAGPHRITLGAYGVASIDLALATATITMTPVPEPGTAALLGIGTAMMAAVRRSRRPA
jgi:hypothetical protein